MSEVKRYINCVIGMTGVEMVRATDYAKLDAEAQALREERDSQQRVAINAMEELAALRARVVVAPERDARRMDTEYPEGWNDCLDELARLGLLRRVCAEPPATCCMDDEMTWRRDLDSALLELRALLNQDKENGNG